MSEAPARIDAGASSFRETGRQRRDHFAGGGSDLM